jgi:MFS family permease
MLRRVGLLGVFVAAGLAAGLAFWHQADWWYYVGAGPERWPKFKAPAWEQFVVSAVAGGFFGGVAVGVVSLIRMVAPRRTRRRT